MRGGHCLKVWTKKQQVVTLSSVESVHRRGERIWIMGSGEHWF